MSSAVSLTRAGRRLLQIFEGVRDLAKGLGSVPKNGSGGRTSSERTLENSIVEQQLKENALLCDTIARCSSRSRAIVHDLQKTVLDFAAKPEAAHEVADICNRIDQALDGIRKELDDAAYQAKRFSRCSKFLLSYPRLALEEPDRSASFPELLQRLENDYPKVFPVWKTLFDNAIPLYRDDPDANLSTINHPTAIRFRDWVHQHAYGRLLDIGCGPVPVPYYLDGYDLNLIAGLDPLEEREIHPFQFYRGFAEYLPWPDGSFETVVIATSLDHVISLRRTLSEIRRVLSPSGVVILWLGFIPGGKYFDPHPDEEPVPIDKYHLFHFDKPWFEEIMAEYFEFEAVQRIDIEQSFYVYSRPEAV